MLALSKQDRFPILANYVALPQSLPQAGGRQTDPTATDNSAADNFWNLASSCRTLIRASESVSPEAVIGAPSCSCALPF